MSSAAPTTSEPSIEIRFIQFHERKRKIMKDFVLYGRSLSTVQDQLNAMECMETLVPEGYTGSLEEIVRGYTRLTEAYEVYCKEDFPADADDDLDDYVKELDIATTRYNRLIEFIEGMQGIESGM